MKVLLVIAVLCGFNFWIPTVSAGSAPGAWSSKFPPTPGADRLVKAMASDGTNLYVGGFFTQIGGVQARGLAKYDGTNWSELAEVEVPNYPGVSALLVHGNDLYVGGSFNAIGGVAAAGIAKWDGQKWTALGLGVRSTDELYHDPAFVSALYHDGTNLWVGGSFLRAGDGPATNIACWTGTEWRAVGDGLGIIPPATQGSSSNFGRVSSIIGDGTNIYAGGQFIVSGTNEIMHLGRWDGSSWRSMGTFDGGFNSFQYGNRTISGSVEVLAIQKLPGENRLLIGGDFGLPARAFTILGYGGVLFSDTHLPARVYAIQVHDGVISLGGSFSGSAFGGPDLAVVSYSEFPIVVGNIVGNGIYSICNLGNRMFVGGDFRIQEGTAANIAEIKEGSVSGIAPNVGNGLSDVSRNLATDGTNVFVLGDFEWAGTNHVYGPAIVGWNGKRWFPVASSPAGNNAPNQFAVVGTNIFVAGRFIRFAGVTNLASWSGNQWVKVGDDQDRPTDISDMVAFDSRLYVAENGGACKWLEGSIWKSLPWITEPSSSQLLSVDGTNLYLARRLYAGVKVARWTNGTIGEIPGILPISTILGLAGMNGNIFVAGSIIDPANPNPVIYRWDGTTWSQFFRGPVGTMAATKHGLVVAGYFDSISRVYAKNIALWNSGQWQSLDSGITLGQWGAIYSLLELNDQLYVAGTFTKAGSNLSENFGVWNFATDVQLRAHHSVLEINGGVGDHVEIQTSSDLMNWTNVTELNFSAPSTQIPNSTETSNRFYRAKILEP